MNMEIRNGEEKKGCEIVLLEPPYFDYYWPYIEREMDTVPQDWAERMTKEALYEAVQDRRIQVWAVGPNKQIRIVVFTQIVHYPVCKVVQVLFAFGNSLETVLPLLDATLERYAALNGCRKIEIIGRRGWIRKLGPLGFALKHVFLERQVQTRELM